MELTPAQHKEMARIMGTRDDRYDEADEPIIVSDRTALLLSCAADVDKELHSPTIKGETMYTEPIKNTAPVSMAQLRTEFVYRLSSFIMNNGQFTIVEDLPVTRPVRSAKKISKKGGQYEVYMIRIVSDDFEGDLEMFKAELMKLAVIMPTDITNYKGVTVVYDGARWKTYPPTTPGQTKAPEIHVPEKLNQIDTLANQLQGTVQLSDVTGKGLSVKDIMVYAEMISPGNALALIHHAKASGKIVEQGGVYKAV